MNILLDTHVIVWSQIASPRLGKKACQILKNESNTLWISAISALEISRLAHGGKLDLGIPVRDWFQKASLFLNARIQPIEEAVAFESYQLPGEFHADPADRILVATARLNSLRLLTADERILAYEGVSTVNACS
ncbi:MAG: type II toxin-antitoxin system VapC family toxin [Verrucomicrobiota bacterium]